MIPEQTTPEMHTLLALRALSSGLVARSQLASRAGLSFNGDRDLFLAVGYKRYLTATDYRDRYERNGIAARVVEAMPKATWRGLLELIEDENPETQTEFEAAWFALNERLKVQDNLRRADILAGIGRYAALVIGAPGELDQPLPDRLKPEEVAFLQPYAEDDLPIASWVTDKQDPRFGWPLQYRLARRSVEFVSRPSTQIHYSRVLHLADGILDDGVFGEPRLRSSWNYFDDLEKVSGGGAEAFWLRVHQGFHFNLDPDTEIDDGELKKMSEEADEFVHGMRRAFRTRGVEMNVKGSDVADISRPVDAIITLISGATSIPKRILLGSERGELASTQDRMNWNDRVQERRDEYAEPYVLRPLIDRFIQLGVLPTPRKEGYTVRWPMMQVLDDLQKVEVVARLTDANTKLPGIIEADELRDRFLGLPPLKAPIRTAARKLRHMWSLWR